MLWTITVLDWDDANWYRLRCNTPCAPLVAAAESAAKRFAHSISCHSLAAFAQVAPESQTQTDETFPINGLSVPGDPDALLAFSNGLAARILSRLVVKHIRSAVV